MAPPGGAGYFLRRKEKEKGHGAYDDGSEESASCSEESGSESSDDDLDEDYEDEDEEEEEEDEEEVEEDEEGESEAIRKMKRVTEQRTSSGDEGGEDGLGEEKLYTRVVSTLQGNKDLNMLKLNNFKAYLRKHGLRLTGSKSVCMQRVQEHWRLRDGNAKKLYPESSFLINCTGDVCAGDVIRFKQRVYDKYEKVKRGGGNIIGKRIIAGKVVKESYGATKSQHTFTVEVLWSKGVRELPTLYQLLVKGRNLYRLSTFRQRWYDEKERTKVLAEKHKRGAAARYIRGLQKAKESALRGPKKHKKTSNGEREQPSKQGKKVVKQRTTTLQRCQPGSAGCAKSTASESAILPVPHGHPHTDVHHLLPHPVPLYTSLHHQLEVHNGNRAPSFHPTRGILGSLPPGAGPSRAVVHHQVMNTNSSFYRPYQVHQEQKSFRYHPDMHFDARSNIFLRCCTHGCQQFASDRCVNSRCWMCCRRFGRPCYGHG